jgi:ankyrin repeat protein
LLYYRLDEKQFAATKLQSVSEKKSAEVKLFEASKDSEWFDAIEKKNCKFLLDLFRSDRSRWVQTGLKGRSVLHVAVMQGCSELVHELHYYEGDLVPCGKNWQTPFEFLWENARDGRLKNASAHDLWLVMEGPVDIAVGRDLFAMSWNDYRMPWNSEDREKLKSRGQWLFGRSRDDYIRSHVMYRMPGGSEDHEMLSLREAISSIANKEKFVMDETDVDFNFENVERKELYLHMACSRLRNVRNQQDFQSSGCEHIRNFIIAVLNHLPQNLLQKLFDQKDAQGRTILQVLITPGAEADDNFVFGTFEEMLKILPDVCVNTLDKAGRTILHWAVAHEIIWAVYRLLKSSKVRRDITFQTAYIENVSALDLILIYDLHLPTDFGLPYWPSLKDELAKQCGVYALYNEEYLASDCKRLNIAHTPLENAIVMGRNKFVKDIMKTLVHISPPLYIPNSHADLFNCVTNFKS